MALVACKNWNVISIAPLGMSNAPSQPLQIQPDAADPALAQQQARFNSLARDVALWRAALAGCLVHTLTTCRDAVAVLVETVGTSAIHRGTRLERHHRDLITIGQHLFGQPKTREWAGGLWFGKVPPSPVL